MKAAHPPRPTATSVATQNACTVCMPLGACLAFRGIEGAMPFLHGPQGCATYIRRFLIGHFREPMDIACSSFNEHSAIFGGGRDLHRGLDNVTAQYDPKLIGVATTCLAETIGDDMGMLLRQYRSERGPEAPLLAWAATPSYNGTHADGFHAAVRCVVEQVITPGAPIEPPDQGDAAINLFPNMLSPADLRYLREMVASFGLGCTMLPDYSETLDRPVLLDYEKIPAGGTSLEAIKQMSCASASILFGETVTDEHDSAKFLANSHGVACHRAGIPIGIRETDHFIKILEDISGQPCPLNHTQERGRLVDAYVDGHKYVFGRRIAIIGEEDLVIGLARFVSEIGAIPVLCATGGRSGEFESALKNALSDFSEPEAVASGVDFAEVESMLTAADAHLVLGSSRCAPMARRCGVQLLRVGMPVHDRIGAQRTLHVGYRGAQALFDAIANSFIELDQDAGDAGYMTM